MVRVPKEPVSFNPATLFAGYAGLEVPDPITFVTGEKWLDQTTIYPRQATMLKIIFLRDDLFTEYDHKVIDEWEMKFKATGNNGITPGVRDRIKYLQENDYHWFREVLLVMGRRAGKGHLSGLSMAYVLWNYMSKGNPQDYYGINKSKQFECLIYAGKKEQARKNLWQDLVNFIVDGPCFSPYVNRPQAETLTVYAPYDKVRMAERASRGLDVSGDQATFRIEPKEATLMSGRGGTSFMQGYDEMAHVVASGANRSAEDIYQAALPALDQFKKDAFIVEPSSPWQMTGQFYKNYENALMLNEETGLPEYPAMLMLQLASWDIYKDWEIAHTLPLFPEGYEGDLGEYKGKKLPRLRRLKSAPQEYDDEMRKLERSNPDTFKVERLSHWATTMDSYLDPDKISAMWDETLQKHTTGRLDRYYKGHGDPSNSNANFGLAIAHLEPHPDQPGFSRCVFDYIHHWKPSDFVENTIDYTQIINELYGIIKAFPVDEFTVDQFNSGPIISMLKNKVAIDHTLTWKKPLIYEVTATAQLNWKKAENFKVALNQGWIAAPFDEQADMELRFLRLVATATTMRVEKQDTGPCTTKDVADAMFECVYALLGDQISAYQEGFNQNPIMGHLEGGITPFGQLSDTEEKMFQMFGGGGAGRYNGQQGFGGSASPTRGFRRDGFKPQNGR